MSIVWRVLVVLFVVVNVLGLAYAVLHAERMHAAIHAGLLVGTWVAWRVRGRRALSY